MQWHCISGIKLEQHDFWIHRQKLYEKITKNQSKHTLAKSTSEPKKEERGGGSIQRQQQYKGCSARAQLYDLHWYDHY